ncbi:AP2-like ethylene-responsive transcription factor [Senna tora]|uniref:AP2-like ethylene-responsive transcription factor n=1 Tax=Senna tora TaxID=362788 RepID=A0A834T461_9FABA|nr:AP2-like ethylene-responsive transcription factor [Senna tora]
MEGQSREEYIGSLRSYPKEAATAYDMAAIEYRGLNAVTNFDLSRYIKLASHHEWQGNATENAAMEEDEDGEAQRLNSGYGKNLTNERCCERRGDGSKTNLAARTDRCNAN